MRSAVVAVVDTGVDDALALAVLARHPAVELRAVVATGGNAPLPRVLANTLAVLAALRVDVAVAAGAPAPRHGGGFPVRAVHGPDGLAGLGPADGADPAAAPAASTLLSAADDPAVTLLVLAPATAVHGWSGPVLACCCGPGETNRLLDPAAAAGLPAGTVHVGADVVAGVSLPGAACPRGPGADLLAGLLAHQSGRRRDGRTGLGDAVAALVVADPGGCGVVTDGGRVVTVDPVATLRQAAALLLDAR